MRRERAQIKRLRTKTARKGFEHNSIPRIRSYLSLQIEIHIKNEIRKEATNVDENLRNKLFSVKKLAQVEA